MWVLGPMVTAEAKEDDKKFFTQQLCHLTGFKIIRLSGIFHSQRLGWEEKEGRPGCRMRAPGISRLGSLAEQAGGTVGIEVVWFWS